MPSIAVTRDEHDAASPAAVGIALPGCGRGAADAGDGVVLEGASRSDAARACGMDRQTLRDWVHRYNAEGLAGLSNRPHGGGPQRRLSAEQEAAVAELVRRGSDPCRARRGAVAAGRSGGGDRAALPA